MLIGLIRWPVDSLCSGLHAIELAMFSLLYRTTVADLHCKAGICILEGPINLSIWTMLSAFSVEHSRCSSHEQSRALSLQVVRSIPPSAIARSKAIKCWV